MSTISRRRIRLKIDVAKRTTEKFSDVSTTQTPEHWKGNDVQFEIGIAFDGSIITDISNLATMTLNIRTGGVTGALLATATISSFTDITDATWAAGTAQHGLITFTGQEMNIVAGDSHWIAVDITTNDAPGHTVTLGASNIKITDDGIGTEADAQAVAAIAYTKDETDGRYVQKYEDLAWQRWHNGRWYDYLAATGLWYPEILELRDGIPTLTPGEGVEL